MYNNGNDSNNEYVTYNTFIDMLSAYQEQIVVTNNPTGGSTSQSSSLTPSSLVIVDELKGFNYLDCLSLSLTSNNPIAEPSNVTAQEFRGKIVGTGNLTSLNLSTGATNGYVLTSDASGNGTWQPASSSSNASTLQYIPFVTNAGTNKTVKIDDTTGPLTYLPSTGELTATTFTGALNGNASTATEAVNSTTVTVSTNDDPTTKYLMFCNTVGNKQPKIDDTTTPLSYVPATSTLTASVFSGSLNGNATTATTATTASDANAIDITSSNTATLQYIPFVTNAGTNKTVKIDDTTGPLTYLPSTGELSAITFTGALNGNASTATTATNATNVNITADNTAGTYYIPFSKTSGTGNKPLYIDDTTGPLTYNPSTSSLTATNFLGNATTSTTSNQTTVNNTSANAVHYLNFTNNHTTGPYTLQATTGLSVNPNDNSITATTFNGALNGNASTASYADDAGIATSANTIGIADVNTNATYYPTFVDNSGVSTVCIDKTTGPMTYNPSTGTIVVPNITSTLNGTASIATKAIVTDNNDNTTYPLVFQSSDITPEQSLLSGTGIYVNPSTNSIYASTVYADLSGNASTSTTASTANQVMCESIDANASYPIVMSSTTGTGEKSLLIDDTTTPLTYNPSTGKLSTNAIQIGTSATSGYVLTADGSGNGTWQASSGSSNASTITLTSDNTSGSYYLPFSKTSAGNDALYIDDTTGPLTYNPSTSTITATNFSGTATNASNVVITSDNTSGTYYVPFSKTTAGTNPLYVDDTTGPLTYNPSSGVLTSTVMKTSSVPSDLSTVVYVNATNPAWYALTDKGVNKLGPSITLTAGVWNIFYQSFSSTGSATATTVTSMQMWLSTLSDPSLSSLSTNSIGQMAWVGSFTTPAAALSRVPLLPQQVIIRNITTTTTYYLIVNMDWNSLSTMYGGQTLYAMRVQ